MSFKKRHYLKNETGRDFVIGDLHGCMDHFNKLLEEVKFDIEKDRMFSVGDLVDRGPDSYGCLKLIRKSWFHAIQGNHEDMMIDCFDKSKFREEYGWFENYGDWVTPFVSQRDKGMVELVAEAKQLPVLITVESDLGTVGITHAEAPKDFNEEYFDLQQLLWMRDKYRWSPSMGKVPNGVDMTIHGHTPVGETPHHHKGMNAWWIDTGCFATGRLTALQISGSDIKDVPNVFQVYIPIH